MIENEIRSRLERNLNIHHLDVVNESYKHVGHAGDNGTGQTHFKLTVVSDDFVGCNRIQRQRKIYDLLSDLFDQGMHALSIDATDIKEFSA